MDNANSVTTAMFQPAHLPSRHPNRLQNKRRKGFTLIEVLIVVGVIAVLIAGLTLVAKKAVDSSRANSCKVTLNGLGSLIDNGVSAGMLKKQPSGAFMKGAQGADGTTGWIEFYDPGTKVLKIDSSTHRSPDFWRQPDMGSSAVNYDYQDVLNPKANVTAENEANWNQSDAILNTGIAIAMLRGVAANAAVLDRIDSRINRTAAFYNASAVYGKGTRVVLPGASTSIPTSIRISPGGTTPPTGWATSYSAVLDPWGSPIIFVPASGLKAMVGGSSTTVTSPDGKPFWASAGPDGNFARGDDNLYSFDAK